ncbi:unnamed protein product [Leptosia nina]|uniref:DNA-(apurinic or apyrimidinic site) endonuclease n=1 Tax=Leptosia nina TaxID=320188 RepID=A0AAV1J5P1_9NEOP
MAPRTAKAKKAPETKVAENEAPKKGRGKGKNIAEEDSQEDEIIVAEKKTTRRGKKVDYNEDLNGKNDESAPPAKKGRGKRNVDTAAAKNQEALEKESVTEETEDVDDNDDANGHSEEESAPPSRKKTTKKEPIAKSKETMKSKAKKTDEVELVDQEEDEKPKGRGRGRKVDSKPEPEEKSDSEEKNEPSDPPITKGRKKPPTKAEKDAEKASKEADRLAKAAAKEADKAAKMAAKEVEKAAKTAAKEAEKAKKDAEKAAKNAAKDAEKAAKLAAKDIEKAAKEADKAIKDSSDAKESDSIDETEAKAEDKDVEAKGDVEPKKGRKGRAKAKEENNDVGEDKEKGSEKGDVIEEQEMEVDDTKPAKTKRGQKKIGEKTEPEEEPLDSVEPTSKRRRKAPEEKGGDTKKTTNKSSTQYDKIDFSNSSKNAQNREWNIKISCWNVDGIRAWLGKGGLEYIAHEKPNILCLQEIKCSRDKLPEEVTNIPGYHAYWLCSEKEGYAGVGIYTTKLAMNVQYGLQNKELDDEGRIITAEYEQFYLICTYVPNSGRKLVTLDKRMKWNEEFRKHVKTLDEKKPVIICGDMNVSHNEIDLTNPKSNKRNAGFTDEERAGMTELLGDGFVDTFRLLYPDKSGAYTFWSYMFNSRAKNVGWRLDYFIISERLLPSLCDSVIRDQVYGSDHCPISLFLHLTSADKPKE